MRELSKLARNSSRAVGSPYPLYLWLGLCIHMSVRPRGGCLVGLSVLSELVTREYKTMQNVTRTGANDQEQSVNITLSIYLGS